MESHLWSTDSRPAYRGKRTLRSSRLPPRCFTVKPADVTTLTGESEIWARLSGYFEELYRVVPLDREFLGDIDAVRDADAPVSCDPVTPEGTRRAVKQVKSVKAPGGCSIYAEMLKVVGGSPLCCGCTLCCLRFGTQG